ncbi:MAG: D-alanyl-D-alanine carboxypeptidase/D-alanyl-D-alanine-endopeptidase [Woeseiaceae bacterium]
MSGILQSGPTERARRVVGSMLVFLIISGIGFEASATDLPPAVVRTLERFDLSEKGLSVRIEALNSGDAVLDHQSTLALNPASTMKLVTTYAALSSLSPGHTWSTDVFLLGEVDEAGVLSGDLALRGGGDPYLVAETLWQLLTELRRRGIQKIDGDIIFDTSFFEIPVEDPAAFDNEPLRAYNVSPDALLVNFKVIRFFFEPDESNNTVRVTTLPELENLDIDNQLKLVRGRCRGYLRGIRIDAETNGERVRFSGNFPSGCKRYSLGRTLLSHQAYAFGLIARQWSLLGGELTGGYQSAQVADTEEPFLSWRSRPFSEVIRLINKHSNNVMTRQVFLTLGAHYFGAPATVEKARRAIDAWALDQSLSLDNLVIDNGAGLSREARMTATEMVGLLQHAWRSPFMPEFVSSLSLVGTDGTFRRRHKSGMLTGRAHLKTGRLDDVTALAGYMTARNGQRYALSILHNDKGVHRGGGEAVQDAILRWLYTHDQTASIPRAAKGIAASQSKEVAP